VTGKVLREARLEGVTDASYASPVAADGKIFLISEQSKLVTVRANAEWTVLSVVPLGEDAYATPAIAEDGKITWLFSPTRSRRLTPILLS
jgi:hypothetical protein